MLLSHAEDYKPSPCVGSIYCQCSSLDASSAGVHDLSYSMEMARVSETSVLVNVGLAHVPRRPCAAKSFARGSNEDGHF